MVEQNRHPWKLGDLKTSPLVKGQAKKEIYLLSKGAKKKMFVSGCSSCEKIKVEGFLKKP